MAWLISNLRESPHFADTVAHHGWTAWWRGSGRTLAQYRAGLEPMITDEGIPMAAIAHEGETYFGSALLIANDLEARPQYVPWIAALWVDVPYRGQGIATALMQHLRDEAERLGYKSVYLCAEPKITPYYLARGWTQIEADVEGLTVFVSDAR
jgi:GNAT superfamily N-acetyltransferase